MTCVKAANDLGHLGAETLQQLGLEAHSQVPTDQPVCFVSREDWVDLANHHLNESRLSKELDS